MKTDFFTPKVFYNDKPFTKNISHELKLFGPVSTIMPYKDAEEAAALAKRGKEFGRFYSFHDENL